MKKERLNLETKRILLRPFELSYGPRVKKLAGDKSLADTPLNIPHPYKDGMAEEWILTHQSKYEHEEEVTCAIILKPIRELIGAIGLTIDKRFNRAELGYWVGKEYWNQGYCTEASKVILKYGFHELGLHRIIATHIIRNPASGKVMGKIGMEERRNSSGTYN